MPKILVKPKETIKKAGKRLLTRKNDGNFTITELSEQSRISRRTFYLRFGSKGALVKDVVLEDWAKDKEKLKKATVSGSSPQERARLLYTRLRGFGDRYSSSFPDIFAGGGLLRTSEDIAGELSDISGLSRFVVEVILTFVPLPEVTYEQIEPQLRKLLSEDRGDRGDRGTEGQRRQRDGSSVLTEDGRTVPLSPSVSVPLSPFPCLH